MTDVSGKTSDLPFICCEEREDWTAWLEENHATSAGVWLRLAKKASRLQTVTYDEAVEIALCYGWIDSQVRGHDAESSLQKFTPRRTRSVWSRINREKAQRLIDSGQMKPAGLRAVEAAQRDGRWDAAYDSPAQATVPPDLQAALDGDPVASAFFATLDSRNRYAILHRIQLAKMPDTRARRISQFVEMLARHEKIYP